MNTRTLRETEAIEIVKALLLTGSAYKTAKLLGKGSATIYRRMKDYGIDMSNRPTLIRFLRSRLIHSDTSDL